MDDSGAGSALWTTRGALADGAGNCRTSPVAWKAGAAAGVAVGDAAHGQAGQIGDLVPGGAGDRDRQRPDRGGLVDYDQQRPVLGEFVEQGLQFGFGAGQWCVVQPFAVGVDRVVGFFADV